MTLFFLKIIIWRTYFCKKYFYICRENNYFEVLIFFSVDMCCLFNSKSTIILKFSCLKW